MWNVLSFIFLCVLIENANVDIPIEHNKRKYINSITEADQTAMNERKITLLCFDFFSYTLQFASVDDYKHKHQQHHNIEQ